MTTEQSNKNKLFKSEHWFKSYECTNIKKILEKFIISSFVNKLSVIFSNLYHENYVTFRFVMGMVFTFWIITKN